MQSVGPVPVPPTAPAPVAGDEKKWCVPRVDASEEALQANIDFVCGLGLDCKPIQEGGPCFEPDDVRSHASFGMNAYFQTYGQHDYNCDFRGTGYITPVDPSKSNNTTINLDRQFLVTGNCVPLYVLFIALTKGNQFYNTYLFFVICAGYQECKYVA